MHHAHFIRTTKCNLERAHSRSLDRASAGSPRGLAVFGHRIEEALRIRCQTTLCGAFKSHDSGEIFLTCAAAGQKTYQDQKRRAYHPAYVKRRQFAVNNIGSQASISFKGLPIAWSPQCLLFGYSVTRGSRPLSVFYLNSAQLFQAQPTKAGLRTA